MNLFHHARIATGALRVAQNAVSATVHNNNEVIRVKMTEDGQRLEVEVICTGEGSDSISLSYEGAKWLAEQLTRIVEERSA